MKMLKYILPILLFSCEALQEIEENLPYEFSITEGWIHFEYGEYDDAEVMFSNVLDINIDIIPQNSYSEAYIGLGWTDLYKANTLWGTGNYDSRKGLRESAKTKFSNAQNGIISFIELEPDLNAGLAYAYSSLALYEDFTGVSYDGVILDSALYYSKEVLNADSSYYFVHDSININSNSLHLLRAQLFLEKNDFESSQIEISHIDMQSDSITFNLSLTQQMLESFPNNFDLFIYTGFFGHNKHYFEMEYVSDSLYTISKEFTPMLPCVELISEDLDLSDNEIVQCLNSFPTNILEFKFSIRYPGVELQNVGLDACNSLDSLDPNLLEYEYIATSPTEGYCLQYIYLEESLDDVCIANDYRILEVFENKSMDYCFSSCLDCSN